MLVIFLWISASIAAGALAMTIWNLLLFRRSDAASSAGIATVTVCIPARNEEANIEACIRSVLANDHPAMFVLVYDDQSTDRTPEILKRLCEADPRIRLCQTRPLPSGWIGKQHACDQLGRSAKSEWLLFIDADVRLAPDCVRRSIAAAQDLNADMVSTFPRQETRSLGEHLLVPMIHFVLLSYLPFVRMRRTPDPAASAACGQFILAKQVAYLACGGHASIRDSMHDGVRLPRVFRRAGYRTDLFDGTDIATCRMYDGLRATWRGFAKNAYEGLNSPFLLLLLTTLHALGHVAPWIILVVAAGLAAADSGRVAPLSLMEFVLAAACVGINLLQRGLIAKRFRQHPIGVLLHPVSIVMMTLVQWHSLALHLAGRRTWRGRAAAVTEQATMAAEGTAT